MRLTFKKQIHGLLLIAMAGVMISCASDQTNRHARHHSTGDDTKAEDLIAQDFGSRIERLAAESQQASGDESASTMEGYQLGAGDVLEVIYQLRNERRPEAYRLEVMDEIDIKFQYTPNYDRHLTVRTDGKISLALVGDITVMGKTTSEVESELKQAYATFLKDPVIGVTVVDSNRAIEELKRAITTAPRGQSRLEPVRPDGSISLPLIGDVKASGRTVPDLSNDIVERYRDQGVKDIDVTVVLLEVKSPVAFVMGEVTNPGSLVMDKPLNVWQTVGQMGGFTPDADLTHVVVAKHDSENATERYVCNFEEWALGNDARDLRITRGDVIYVPRKADRSVYVLGEVEKPGSVKLESTTRLTATQALSMAGRITARSDQTQVLILRRSATNDPVVIEVDMKDVFDPGNYEPGKEADEYPYDPVLLPGDIVYVPRSAIGDVDHFAEAWFRDGIWTIVPFHLNAVYSLN